MTFKAKIVKFLKAVNLDELSGPMVIPSPQQSNNREENPAVGQTKYQQLVWKQKNDKEWQG